MTRIISKCNLKNVIKSSEAWIIPYISQLVGEYVIEILFEINSNLDKIERVKYIEFFKDNPVFYNRMKQRVISY